MDDRGSSHPPSTTSSGSRLNHTRDPWQKWSWLVPVVVVAALAVAYVLLKGPLHDSPGGGGVADAELDVEAFEEDAPDGTAVDVPAEDAVLAPDEGAAVDAVPVESGEAGEPGEPGETSEADGAEVEDDSDKTPVEPPVK